MANRIQTLKRNYFKAENYLIINDLSTNADTIMTTVTRNGEIERFVRLKDGQEIEVDKSILDELTEKQKKNLIEY